MPKIKILPDVLANQIAAGEIVERPASVVKELIENSLDANSQSISVEVSQGGRDLIRVRDDGEGMSYDDAILAFEHHATSKIRETEDLLSIATLGFRGEALPSIASVSRLIMKSIDAGRSDLNASIGTEVIVHGGVIKSVKSVSWPMGTEVTIQDLFYNVPARKKFLKSNDTEIAHITRLVMQYAMANPSLIVALMHDGRKVFEYVETSGLEERLYQVLGAQIMQNLVPFDGTSHGFRVFGYTSRPHEQRSNPNWQYFFVNGRAVRDRVIGHAVHQAYGPALPKSTYPVVILFVESPPTEIDVNVHPAKAEIRFRDQNTIHELIRSEMEKGLLLARPIPRFCVPEREVDKKEINQDYNASLNSPKIHLGSGSKAVVIMDHNQSSNSVDTEPPIPCSQQMTLIPNHKSILVSNEDNIDNIILSNTLICEKLPLKDDNFFKESLSIHVKYDNFSTRIIGQLLQTYILASDNQGLIIIDQHVAHERILYERLLNDIQKQRIIAQRLLVPMTFELTPSQQVVLHRIRTELIASGFEVEEFGGHTIAVKSVPASLSQDDSRLLILDILDRLIEDSQGRHLLDWQRTMAASLACRTAIKANSPLSMEKMERLMEELGQTNFPHSCPHGRPIQIRVAWEEIARRFQRA